MKRTAIYLAVLAVALVAVSIGQVPSPSRKERVAAQQGDDAFIRAAFAAGQTEIQAGRLASERAERVEIKRFAQKMIDEHGATNEKLKSIAIGRGIDLPAAPEPYQRDLDRLRVLQGDEFERAYLAGQIKAHRQAVSLFSRQASSGQDDQLKRFATETLPRIRERLSMAEQLGGRGRVGNMPGPPASA